MHKQKIPFSYNNQSYMIDGKNITEMVDECLEHKRTDDYCKNLIEILQYIYNNTNLKPPISDDKYDQLYAQYILNNKDIVGSKLV